MFEPGEIVVAIVNIVSGTSVAIFYRLVEIIYFCSVLVVYKVLHTCYDGLLSDSLRAGKNRLQLKGSRIPATKGFWCV